MRSSGDHLRVEHRRPGRHGTHGVKELSGVSHPVLEEVAHPRGRLATSLGGILLLDVRTGWSTTTAVLGCISRTTRAARMPSEVKAGGIRTSMTT